MKNQPTMLDSDAIDALDRVNDIKAIFKNVRDLLRLQIAAFGPPDAQTPKPILTKLAELQSAHLTLIKAEEAFHDTFRSADAADAAEYDAIRDQIGRALDRIRAAENTGDVSE